MNKEDDEETEKQQNQESDLPKRYKVKEIKKLEEEVSELENNILIAGVVMLMSTAALLGTIYFQPEEMERFVSCCRFVIILIGIRGFRSLLTSILKKVKLEGKIEYLEELEKSLEVDLDEQFEEEMKGR